MSTVGEILSCLEARIPPALAEAWDNSGHQIGGLEEKVTGVLLSLDVTSKVVKEASKLGCNLIICHHPIIFHSIKAVTAENPESRVVYELLRSGIQVIAIHTPLDSVAGGINDLLANKLGVSATTPLCEGAAFPGAGIGRIGSIEQPMPLQEFIKSVKSALDSPIVQFKNAEKMVQKIAIVSGSGDDYIGIAAAKGCDTFLTGDLKYHTLTAESDMNLICGGHFHTEVFGLSTIEEILHGKFDTLKVIESQEQYHIISYK